MNTYQTKDVTIRVASEPQGKFVQMQVAIMMTRENATQLVEAVRALSAQIPGDAEADAVRSSFVDEVTKELAQAAAAVSA